MKMNWDRVRHENMVSAWDDYSTRSERAEESGVWSRVDRDDVRSKRESAKKSKNAVSLRDSEWMLQV